MVNEFGKDESQFDQIEVQFGNIYITQNKCKKIVCNNLILIYTIH